MFFTFPENVRCDAERQAVEFGVSIGKYQAVVRHRDAYSNAYFRWRAGDGFP
jgi:hypothetical protein